MSKITSTISELNRPKNIDNSCIEKELSAQFGDIIRWSVIDVNDKTLKISVAYKDSNQR